MMMMMMMMIMMMMMMMMMTTMIELTQSVVSSYFSSLVKRLLRLFHQVYDMRNCN